MSECVCVCVSKTTKRRGDGDGDGDVGPRMPTPGRPAGEEGGNESGLV